MQTNVSTIREQLIGITASIVLIFLLTGTASLYFLLHGTVEQAASAISFMLVAVPCVAWLGYQHGRELVGAIRYPDAVHFILGFSALTGLCVSFIGTIELLHRAGLLL